MAKSSGHLAVPFRGAYLAFASLWVWGKFGGLHACGATCSYIVPLPMSSAKSFSFRSRSEKEELPRGSTPDLETSAQRPVGKRTHLPGEHGLYPRFVRSNQASATKISFLSRTSANPATIRIDSSPPQPLNVGSLRRSPMQSMTSYKPTSED
jgi:hypothetical protein